MRRESISKIEGEKTLLTHFTYDLLLEYLPQEGRCSYNKCTGLLINIKNKGTVISQRHSESTFLKVAMNTRTFILRNKSPRTDDPLILFVRVVQ